MKENKVLLIRNLSVQTSEALEEYKRITGIKNNTEAAQKMIEKYFVQAKRNEDLIDRLEALEIKYENLLGAVRDREEAQSRIIQILKEEGL